MLPAAIGGCVWDCPVFPIISVRWTYLTEGGRLENSSGCKTAYAVDNKIMSIKMASAAVNAVAASVRRSFSISLSSFIFVDVIAFSTRKPTNLMTNAVDYRRPRGLSIGLRVRYRRSQHVNRLAYTHAHILHMCIHTYIHIHDVCMFSHAHACMSARDG